MVQVAVFIENTKRVWCFILFLFIFQGSIFSANAQGNTVIHGKVVDERTGETIIGANISSKGTTINSGTITDLDGVFDLKVPSLPATIVVSYIGYRTQEIDIYEASKETIVIPLVEDLNTLNEIVVIGYGTQKKGDLTGSITSIPTESLNQTVSSFERTLQGAVSGVQITQNSGQPGGATTIRIRGSNSVNAGNEPLYVIDGFPVYSNNNLTGSDATRGTNINALASINPNDIESISVLKDASATAIYGARGANGVIIITTKKGKVGKAVVSYDYTYGDQSIIHPVETLTDTKEWARLRNEAITNAGKNIPLYTEAEIAALPKGTDWQRAAFRHAPIQSHQISVSGGTESTHYAISGNYFDQDGIIKNTNFKRYSGRINLDQKVFSRLTVGTNLTVTKTESDIAPIDIRNLLLIPPTVPVRDPNGDYHYQSDFETNIGNAIAALDKVSNTTTSFRFLGNAYGEYNFGKGFSAKVSLGTDVISTKGNYYWPSDVYQGANAPTVGVGQVGNRTSFSWLNENTVNYSGVFNRVHALSVVAGYTQQAFTLESVRAGSQGFVNDNLEYNNLGSAEIYNQPQTGREDWALNSWLARANYGYDSRYLITFTGRADGSSRFGQNNKWGFFPSGAVAWNLSNEEFFRLPRNVINDLKLRGSIGLTGNQEIGLYKSLATLKDVLYYFGGESAIGFSPNGISNKDLGWERTLQYDGGIDVSFFKDKLTLTLDGYYKKTSDLLLNVQLPYTSGQKEALLNYGSVANKGFELGIGTNLKLGQVTWTGNLTYSINRNEVLSLGDGNDYIINGVSIVQVGKPLGSFYGLQTDGIFQLSDDTNGDGIVDNLPVYLTRNHVGDQRYKNIDGSTDNKITQDGDRTIIGSAEPKFIGGFINSFAWRDFDFSFFLQGSYGNQVYNRNIEQLEILSGQQGVSLAAADRWTPTNPSNTMPRAYADPAVTISSRNVEDASYLRLKDITLGYTLPKKFTTKFFVQSLRFYVSAQNLLTATKYSGYDPEVNTNTASTNPGIDNGSYPSAKSFYGGLSVKF